MVISEGVYLKLTGKTLVRGGVDSRHGLRGRMPLPLLVVHSGKTTTTLFRFCFTNVSRSTRVAPLGGVVWGWRNALIAACSSDTGWTSLFDGKHIAKTGSKMAARYRASIGEALEAAIIEPSLGRRA